MRYLILLYLVLQSFFATAQVAEDSLKQIVYDFAAAYSELGTTGDKEKILQYMDKKVKSTLLAHDIGGNIKAIHSDYKGFERHLDRILHLKGLSINYKISDVIITYVRDNAGVVAYTVKYKTERNGKTWVKGTETVSLAFKRFPDRKWRIVHYTVIGVEDEKVKGACTCELFSQKSGKIAAKTIIPAGEEYQTQLEEFRFQTGSDGDRYIEIDNDSYRWASSGDIFTYKKDGKEVAQTKLGHAKSARIAILHILHKDRYAKSCVRLKIAK